MTPLVCHVNLASGYRGGERQAELLIRALRQMGYRQRLIAREGEPLLERMRELPGLECVGMRLPFTTGLRACRGAGVIQVHEGRGGHLACIAHSLYGIPYVITRRTYSPPRASLLNRRLYANAAAVVAVSSMIAELLRKLDLRPGVEVLADAHSDLQADPAATSAIRQRFAGKFLLGHAAAMVPNKGQAVLIEAMRLLADELPELQLLLLGRGRDEAMLRQAAAGLDNVCFEGFTERLGDYFAALDLYVHPSHIEGLGSVLLDAMQAGLPIIASRAGGIPEIVHDRVNGLLVPPGDPQALAAAIRRLYADTELRSELAQRGQEQAVHYSPEIMGQRYAQLYSALGIA